MKNRSVEASENEAKRAGRRQRSCHTLQLKLSKKKDEREWLARRVWGEGESEFVTKRAGRGKNSVGRTEFWSKRAGGVWASI